VGLSRCWGVCVVVEGARAWSSRYLSGGCYCCDGYENCDAALFVYCHDRICNHWWFLLYLQCCGVYDTSSHGSSVWRVPLPTMSSVVKQVMCHWSYEPVPLIVVIIARQPHAKRTAEGVIVLLGIQPYNHFRPFLPCHLSRNGLVGPG